MKFLKIGAIDGWITTTEIEFPGKAGQYTGAKLTVLAERDTIMEVEDNATPDESGEPRKWYVPINRGEMTEVEVRMNGGGTLKFEHAVNLRTKSNRSGNFEMKGPKWVKPPRERQRDPHAEMIAYLAKQNEKMRAEQNAALIESHKAQLEELRKEAEELRKAAEPKKEVPATPSPEKSETAAETLAE
jgi:hypothetical protein